jgi:hypothetical protein
MAAFLMWLANPPAGAAATNQMPDFREVYGLILAHASGVTEAELNRAAVQGLLAALGPNVSLESAGASTNTPAETALVSQERRFDGDIAYLRIARVGEGLAGKVRETCRQLSATNRLHGIVLDLRFADGADYAAAVATADLFVSKAEPLLDWGNGMASSLQKSNWIRGPVAVLVNHETARAAEALAAMLRLTGAGLILGGRTAGQAMVTQDFPLKDGLQLRIATTPVTLGDGSKFSSRGIEPDIAVTVSAETERAYFDNPFRVASGASRSPGGGLAASSGGATNSVTRRGPMNEAELVREHRLSLDADGDLESPTAAPAPRAERQKPVVTDPALARGLDLLKGLALVRQDRF